MVGENVNYIELKNWDNIIVTTDNAGSIGRKENDTIQTCYDTLSYFTVRNALMENITKNTTVIAVSYANFCGDEHHEELMRGMNKVFDELGYKPRVIGSTESNFEMTESAFSTTVIGTKLTQKEERYSNYAVVGLPLVGDEVLSNMNSVISLRECLMLLSCDSVSKVIPIGSKGINHRCKKLLNIEFKSSAVDLYKSAGPSTCVVIEYKNLDSIPISLRKKITKLHIKKNR